MPKTYVQQVQPTIGTGAVGGALTGNSERLVPELWAKEIAEYRHDNLVLWALTDMRYSGEISQKGDVLHIDFLGEVEEDFTSNYEVGTDVEVKNVEVDQVDLIIDRYPRTALGIQDALKAQSAYELRSPHTARLARWLDKAKDAEVYKKAVAGFSNTPIVTTGTGGALSFEDVVEAMTVLDANNVPEDERALVVNSRVRGDLRKIPEFTSYKETGDKGLVKNTTGFVGILYGVPVYVTNIIGANNGYYDCLLFHKSALIGATQNVPRIESGRNHLKGQDELVASELFGVKVLRPDHGVVIRRPEVVISVPGAPTGVTAVAGDTEATVTFTAPANDGGGTITSYTVTSAPGNITATGSDSPITVTGLTNGVEYTFTVVATNSAGDSAESEPSNAVEPTS